MDDSLDEFVDSLVERIDWLAADIDNTEIFAFGLTELDDLLRDDPDDE